MGDLWSDEGFGGGGFGGEGFGDEDDWDEGVESLETDVEDALAEADEDDEVAWDAERQERASSGGPA
jgi:hypothetical protein